MMFHINMDDIYEVVTTIQSWGWLGVGVALLMQTLLNMFPLPGEFTAVILLGIYGPVLGGVYIWISGMLGAIGGYYLMRWMAKPIINARIEPYITKIDAWIRQHEGKGLFLARFVPLIPYHLVNYVAGILKVNLLTFIWTTGIGILPQTVAMSLLFAGVQQGSMTWGFLGCSALLVLGGIAWYGKRK